ncbi:histone deacetylase [Eremomyces bilateralis CBS 781.70]|uniref:Histone deacetylase n=1 Tax=Eremomyces bilateralis CBS 781.70 TaxID=1392243 RepID=A0A6G1GDT2_9PEZI|nr:histone deacetylase [Eremomyces bilateralis CBS 781.70]KAF1816208.1 histone deacetylase [Eremomyces bilateralis CBS 781.70]
MPVGNFLQHKGNGIVQEWDGSDIPRTFLSPEPPQLIDLETWRGFTDEQKLAIVEKEADENGIERPTGYNVSFHYNPKVEGHHFGRSHPMKPWRLTLTKQLVLGYGLQYAMDTYVSRPASRQELEIFHGKSYLNFLSSITPENMEQMGDLGRFNFGDDCPVFDGMWDYCRLYAGASFDAAAKLISKQSDIAINWSGGLHHAKKNEASGFCYINDIVLAIQAMLTVESRVLYVDIDVHHGDGVEQAFWSTDRVMTLSYHKFGDFFPGTGAMDETGPESIENPGWKMALNVPLHDGIDDEQYRDLFSEITGAAIETFNPGAIVLQCGADSLGGDRLGKFNLNIRAHGYCIEFVKSKCHNRRLMLVGGGGYTPRNVARAWCHETSVCVGASLKNHIPGHVPYRQAFTGEENGDGLMYPDLANHPSKRHPNLHSKEYLQMMKQNIHTQLRFIQNTATIKMDRLPDNYLQLRAEVDKQFREEQEERERLEAERKQKEKNIGSKNELRGT